MNLFDYAKQNYSVYPEMLGYFYMDRIIDSFDIIDEINKYDFVFVASDFDNGIPRCKANQIMTSSDTPRSTMWLQQDYSGYQQMPTSEYTEVPTVGFVGRCPILKRDGENIIHHGFEPRYKALEQLMMSDEICIDFHIRVEPTGESCGFWDKTLPDFKKNGPLFKTNMLANQYQACARGNANWSLRFYETLAYGRIPILIDSGGKFPLFEGSYDDFKQVSGEFSFPHVHEGEDIEKVLLEFHNELDKDSIKSIQNKCRSMYDYFFSQDAQCNAFDMMFNGFRK